MKNAVYSFEDINEALGSAYKMLQANLAEKDDSKGSGMDPEKDDSSWDILYGYETREALKKIKEADMWLQSARDSIG